MLLASAFSLFDDESAIACGDDEREGADRGARNEGVMS